MESPKGINKGGNNSKYGKIGYKYRYIEIFRFSGFMEIEFGNDQRDHHPDQSKKEKRIEIGWEINPFRGRLDPNKNQKGEYQDQ